MHISTYSSEYSTQRQRSEEAVAQLNKALYADYEGDRLVTRGLPIDLTQTSSRAGLDRGKCALHRQFAARRGVLEGIHVDDNVEICSSFKSRWNGESRIFRIQYSDPGFRREQHPEQSLVFRSLHSAFTKILGITDIVQYCSPQRTVQSHR